MIPRVSIGLPVRNGANFIRQAIDSILGQTFEDLELVISDNASTDETEAICKRYVERDKRVRYVRSEANVGAARNYNRVVDLARADYFKWAAHDDLLAPAFLERCVEVLDHDHSVVLSYPRIKEIDEHGEILRVYPELKVDSTTSSGRFRQCVCVPHSQAALFGVMQIIALRKTRLVGAFSSSDRVLLGELALLGRFHEIPEFLFFKRNHPHAHWRVHRTRRARQVWYDPARAGKITFPHWRLLREHFGAVMRTPMGRCDRLLCFGQLSRWMKVYDGPLVRELLLRDG